MSKTAILLVGLCVLIGICGRTAHAQTINAASCDPSDVQRALDSVNQATATVVIPSGTCSWSSALSYTVPSSVTSLTIQGQTTVNCTGTSGTSSYACTDSDNTVLEDSYAASNQPIWALTLSGGALRITGIAFEGGTATSGDNKPNGFVVFYGSSSSVRVDHCDFNTNTYTIGNFGGGVTIYGNLNGSVFDHDTFEMSGENNGIRDYAGGPYGDTSWSQPTNFGSSNFVFAEDDIFNGGAANDCNDGGRMVVRYSTVEPTPENGDSGMIQTHTVGQGDPRARGCRAMEEYHNYSYNPNPTGNNEYSARDGDSGTGLVWDNTISSGYSYDIVFQVDREASAGHGQPAPPNGWGDCGSNSTGVTSQWDGNSIASTGYPCLDQTGRGQGDLLNGLDFPNVVDTVTGTQSWPHNLLEPWYVWGETVASGQVYNAPAWNDVAMVANRDFYVQNSSFNGTSGVGQGALSSRPSTCTPGAGGAYGQSPTGSYGVAYWATDVNNGIGELYVCTSTNTWTAVYTPYTYPHPLVIGGTTGTSGNAPVQPTNLTALVQ